MIKNVIFDLDGTLVDSAGDIIDCLKEAYCAANINFPIPINKSCIGPPLPEIIKSIMPDISEEELNKIVKEFRNCYDKSAFKKTRIYEGVDILLHKLASMDIKMFIATSKPIVSTRRILLNSKIDYFCDIISPDMIQGVRLDKMKMVSYLIKKWKLKKARTLMVGDSASDIFAAHNNSIISVAVLNGYGDPSIIYDSGPDYAIYKIGSLYNLITKLMEEDANGQRYF